MRTVVRGAVSPTADDSMVSALNQRSRVSLTAFRRDTIFSRHDFKFAITGASLYTDSSPRVKRRTIPHSICGSDSSVQHADPSLREKVSLCEQGMTHKILHTRHCPFHFLMVNFSPIQ